MSDQKLNIALISGPMYDGLYQSLPEFEKQSGLEVRIAFRGTHPEINAHLEGLGDAAPYDLVSAHTKYAPSQVPLLAPLDDLITPAELQHFYPALIELARIEGALYGVPRNIDVKLLHYRTDIVAAPPETWEELVDLARELIRAPELYGFVFPGMDSGLFGLFYELAEMAGASLFPKSNAPSLKNDGGRWALKTIGSLYRSGSVPSEIVNWHYDEAHICFREGRAAMISDWPGYYGAHKNSAISKVSELFQVARMPAGIRGTRQCYSGSHTFALTRRGVQKPEALNLLRFLTSPERQRDSAESGSVPTRPAVLQEVINESAPLEAQRWQMLDTVIANDMLIPPRFAYYPEIEEILWRTVRSAMTGEISDDDALETMERRIIDCHQGHASQR
jgi:multiple sugar transport system substrate-binding protein